MTPPDLISQVLMALPLMGLYELSILLSKLFGKKAPPAQSCHLRSMAESPYKITRWPKNERPRERLLQHGPQHLTEAELLGILLGKGTRERQPSTWPGNS